WKNEAVKTSDLLKGQGYLEKCPEAQSLDFNLILPIRLLQKLIFFLFFFFFFSHDILDVIFLEGPSEVCGQLAAGTCEIVTLDRDSSQPRRTIARQTARCACKKGQIAGTTRARPACVDARIIKTKQWCEMLPCLEGEGCDLLINKSGWTCTQPGGRIKTTTTEDQMEMS
uniref:TAFA chemokine like family member 5 n=1 Tax=Cairina moschata TaxID=8855 RepID=A0A8C3BH41_CAIMO